MTQTVKVMKMTKIMKIMEVTTMMTNARESKMKKCYGETVRKLSILQKVGQFVLMYFVMTLLCTQIDGFKIDEESYKNLDVNRINYGVIFHHMGMTKPVTAIWRHTFKVPMPSHRLEEDLKISEEMDLTETFNKQTPCSRYKGGPGVAGYVAFCKRILRQIEFLIEIGTKGQKRLHDLLK